MSTEDKMHIVQQKVLYTLQQATRARFSELMRTSSLQSDSFKFHLRKLMKIGLIFKASDGLYELSAEGKAFVSRLDRKSGLVIPQPKSSMLMVVLTNDGQQILGHMRTREPFRDFWGIASAPVLRGVPLKEAAARELNKQTGIYASFEIRGLYRVIDKNQRGTVLEDKLFTIMVAELENPEQPQVWTGGVSRWMDVEQLLAMPKLFPTTHHLLEMLSGNEVFGESVYTYSDGDY